MVVENGHKYTNIGVYSLLGIGTSFKNVEWCRCKM